MMHLILSEGGYKRHIWNLTLYVKVGPFNVCQVVSQGPGVHLLSVPILHSSAHPVSAKLSVKKSFPDILGWVSGMKGLYVDYRILSDIFFPLAS